MPSDLVDSTSAAHTPTLDVLTNRFHQQLASAAATPEDETCSTVAFLTIQSAQHSGRNSGYINTVLSVRVGSAIGSCAIEPENATAVDVSELSGRPVRELLEHSEISVRVAALDAYLASLSPHAAHPRCRSVRLPTGTSLDKSLARVRAVADLLDVAPGSRIAVIGVVNSLLAELRERGMSYVPCDIKGGHTEWSEPVLTDYREAIDGADAVLASGMILGNGTFENIAEACEQRGIPLAVFAQTGSAVFREFLGTRVHALSAEPYPFFWLSGGDTDIHLYHAHASGGDPQ